MGDGIKGKIIRYGLPALGAGVAGALVWDKYGVDKKGDLKDSLPGLPVQDNYILIPVFELDGRELSYQDSHKHRDNPGLSAKIDPATGHVVCYRVHRFTHDPEIEKSTGKCRTLDSGMRPERFGLAAREQTMHVETDGARAAREANKPHLPEVSGIGGWFSRNASLVGTGAGALVGGLLGKLFGDDWLTAILGAVAGAFGGRYLAQSLAEPETPASDTPEPRGEAGPAPVRPRPTPAVGTPAVPSR